MIVSPKLPPQQQQQQRQAVVSPLPPHGLKSRNGTRLPCGHGIFVPIPVPFVGIRSTNRALNTKQIRHLPMTMAFLSLLEIVVMSFIWTVSNDG